MLIVALALGVLAVHSVLYAAGKMASNGELRYLLTVAPFWALLSARGWGWACGRLRFRWVYASAGIAALAAIGLYFKYPTLPPAVSEETQTAYRVAEWYAASAESRYPGLIAAHPGVAFALDRPPTDSSLRTVDARPAGTVLVFDPVYSVYNSDAGRSVSPEVIEAAGWAPLPTPGLELPEGWAVYVAP